jgi:hypothetical protein
LREEWWHARDALSPRLACNEHAAAQQVGGVLFCMGQYNYFNLIDHRNFTSQYFGWLAHTTKVVWRLVTPEITLPTEFLIALSFHCVLTTVIAPYKSSRFHRQEFLGP